MPEEPSLMDRLRVLAKDLKSPDEIDAMKQQQMAQPEEPPIFAPEPDMPELEAPEPMEAMTTAEITETRMRQTPELQAVQARKSDLATRQKAALDAVAAAETAGTADQMRLMDELATEEADLSAEEQTVRSEYSRRISEAQAEIDAERSQLAQMKPETFWQREDTGSKLLMGLAVLVGGLGAGLAGGENQALKAMNNAIDRDLQQQEALFRRKVASIRERERGAEAMEKSELRLLSGLHARRQAALDQFKGMIDKVALQTRDATAKAKLEQLKIAVDEQQLEQEEELARELAGKVTTKRTEMQAAGKGAIPYTALPAEAKEASSIITKKNASLLPIRNEIASALDQLNDPSLSRDDKLRVGAGLIKTMNSTQGSDAVGAEEAARLAGELQGNIGKVGQAAGVGLAAGATPGALAAGPLGAAVGGSLGFVAGSVAGLLDAIDDPGGLRFRADLPGFTKRTELMLKKVDKTLERNEMANKFIKRGIDPGKAARLADQELRKRLEK